MDGMDLEKMEMVGDVNLTNKSWEFSLAAVFESADGELFFGTDSGCSCPVAWEDTGRADLRPVRSMEDFNRFMNEAKGGSDVPVVELRRDVDRLKGKVRRRLAKPNKEKEGDK